jgi:type II secretory pathway component GspD/PulD (secretin)
VLYQQVAGKYGVSFSTPSSLVNNDAGAIAFNILNPAGAHKGFNGSQAIFEALSAATHVIEAKPFDILAINNEPTTLSNINQQTFIASTTVVPTGISGTPVYTQNPGYATYGQLIQISPTILPQQKVMVRFGIDDTKLKQLIVSNQPGGMDKVLLGGLTYQTKAILNIGSTLILSGFKVKTSTLNEQGLLSEQRMGSEAGVLDSTETIIMITPYLAGN